MSWMDHNKFLANMAGLPVVGGGKSHLVTDAELCAMEPAIRCLMCGRVVTGLADCQQENPPAKFKGLSKAPSTLSANYEAVKIIWRLYPCGCVTNDKFAAMMGAEILARRNNQAPQDIAVPYKNAVIAEKAVLQEKKVDDFGYGHMHTHKVVNPSAVLGSNAVLPIQGWSGMGMNAAVMVQKVPLVSQVPYPTPLTPGSLYTTPDGKVQGVVQTVTNTNDQSFIQFLPLVTGVGFGLDYTSGAQPGVPAAKQAPAPEELASVPTPTRKRSQEFLQQLGTRHKRKLG